GLVSYEYFRRSPLDAVDREFFDPTMSQFIDLKLIPEQRRHGAIATLSQRVSEDIEVSSDLFFSQRESVSGYRDLDATDVRSQVRQSGGSLGMKINIARDWQARLTGLFDQNESEGGMFDGVNGSELVSWANKSQIASLDIAADGSIMSAPGGVMRLAISGQARREKFTEDYASYPASPERDVVAGYAEVLIPWISGQN